MRTMRPYFRCSCIAVEPNLFPLTGNELALMLRPSISASISRLELSDDVTDRAREGFGSFITGWVLMSATRLAS